MNTETLMFTRLGRYALRTVAIIAGCEQRITGKDLAARTGVPPSYQSKILRRLVEADILSARKGHHGGFALAHQPERIPLAKVLSAVEALPTSGVCVFNWGPCSTLDKKWSDSNLNACPCPLHTKWNELSEQVMTWAVETTLADIARQV